MARFQYPALQGPVGPPPASPPATVPHGWDSAPADNPRSRSGRWHAAIIAAALIAPVGIPVQPNAGWNHAQAAMPARAARVQSDSVIQAAYLPPPPSIATPKFAWPVASPDPVRSPKRPQVEALSWGPHAIAAAAATPQGWGAVTADLPRHAARAQPDGMAWAPRSIAAAVTTVTYGWDLPSATPLPRKERAQGEALSWAPQSIVTVVPQGWSVRYAAQVEAKGFQYQSRFEVLRPITAAVTVTFGWDILPADPPKAAKRVQPDSVVAALPTITPYTPPAIGWLVGANEPPKGLRRAQLEASVAVLRPISLATVPAWGWYAPLSEPVVPRARPLLEALSAALPPIAAPPVVTPAWGWDIAAPAPLQRRAVPPLDALSAAPYLPPPPSIATPPFGWHAGPSEPVRRIRFLDPGGLILAPETITPVSVVVPQGWQVIAAEAVKRRPVPPSELFYLAANPPAPPAVPPMGWLVALSEPIPPSRPTWIDSVPPFLREIPANPARVDPLYIVHGRPIRFTALGRSVLIVTGRVGMKANDLSPPLAAVTETRPVTFDFGEQLASGVTITSATVNALVHSGDADATPNANWQGTLAIVASPATGATDQAVVQQYGFCPGSTVYTLQCRAVCSDGSAPTLETTLQSYTVT